MMFEDISHFRTVLREYAIEMGFTLVRLKNERVRLRAHCGSRGCNWRIHASLLPDGLTFKIKSLGPDHTCVRVERNPEATSTWIVEKFIRILKGNPGMTLEAMHNELTEKYGVKASRMQLYRGKRKALEAIECNHAASYSKLLKYANDIMKTNPGSLVKIERDRVGPKLDVVMFKRIFISLAAMQKGFKDGCRPFIGVDGCHLKGPYGGVLLAVVALDRDNGLFLLAYAVVECECKES
ncbi:hypothetical protein ACSBR2_009599 [Camellia fascicularis]